MPLMELQGESGSRSIVPGVTVAPGRLDLDGNRDANTKLCVPTT